MHWCQRTEDQSQDAMVPSFILYQSRSWQETGRHKSISRKWSVEITMDRGVSRMMRTNKRWWVIQITVKGGTRFHLVVWWVRVTEECYQNSNRHNQQQEFSEAHREWRIDTWNSFSTCPLISRCHTICWWSAGGHGDGDEELSFPGQSKAENVAKWMWYWGMESLMQVKNDQHMGSDLQYQSWKDTQY